MRRKKDFTKLPESELQIMQLIWDMDKKGVKDIHAGALLAAYPDQIGHLALTTVLTLISRLQLKGFIDLEKHGRANCAIVLADEKRVQAPRGEGFCRDRLQEQHEGTYLRTLQRWDPLGRRYRGPEKRDRRRQEIKAVRRCSVLF